MEYFKSSEFSDTVTVYFDGEEVYFNGGSVNNEDGNCHGIINSGEAVCMTNEITSIDTESPGTYAMNGNISGDSERNLIDNNELPCMYANQSHVSFRNIAIQLS